MRDSDGKIGQFLTIGEETASCCWRRRGAELRFRQLPRARVIKGAFSLTSDTADDRHEMFFTFSMAVLNLTLGFALAAYLGGHYCLVRKFGLKVPVLAKKKSAAP